MREKKYGKNLRIGIALLLASSFLGAPTALAGDAELQVANDYLPVRAEDGYNYGGVTFDIKNAEKNIMTIAQTGQDAVIEWEDFSLGANAALYFTGPENFHVLNYVTGDARSQIYGYIDAEASHGNIYLINPNGVQIGNSAEIHVGSFFAANWDVDKEMYKGITDVDAGIAAITNDQKNYTTTELMSLGHIRANEVTFDGDRVVIDLDRLHDTEDIDKLPDRVFVGGMDDGLNNGDGYRRFDLVLGSYNIESLAGNQNIKVYNVKEGLKLEADGTHSLKGGADTTDMQNHIDFYRYKWIRTGDELTDLGRQTVTDDEYSAYTKTVASGETSLTKEEYAAKIYTEKMAGHYALRYAINLTGYSFTPIGTEAHPFTGKLDGLDNNIFGLTILKSTTDTSGASDYVGLFGVTKNASVGYIDLISGNESTDIQGHNYVGSLIGKAINTKVRDIETTYRVVGYKNVGGLIGEAVDDETQATEGVDSFVLNAVNMNHVKGHENVGGIIGHMVGGKLGVGEEQKNEYSATHNLGKIQGINDETKTLATDPEHYYSSAVGGLVGYAEGKAVIGGIVSYDLNETGTRKMNEGTGDEYVIYENTPIVNTDGATTLYNTGEIIGGYDVGGIVGHGVNVVIANVRNENGIEANGFTTKYPYIFQTDYTSNNYRWDNINNVATTDGTRIVKVRAGNAGGIVGNLESNLFAEHNEKAMNQSIAYILKAENRGNVTATIVAADTTKGKDTVDYYKHYMSGNIGGIAGRAKDVNMDNVVNTEADVEGAKNEAKISGANNVGGIAGYFGQTMQQAAVGKDFRIMNAKNDGGEVVATGGVHGDLDATGNKVFLTEIIRQNYSDYNKENYIIGNAGGIVGYMRGTLTHIDSSANRGEIHSQYYTDAANIPATAQAANVGGIVGKLDRTNPHSEYNWGESNVLDLVKYGQTTFTKDGAIVTVTVGPSGKTGEEAATIASVYNTGHIAGYTGIGGIIGMSYNGGVVDAYNLGNVLSTRIGEDSSEATSPSNIGGIIGDSTENSSARVVLYNVYNKGTIGDSSYATYGRHVGGLVGRLSGLIENAYNTGYIYNGAVAVGGLVGYWYSGEIRDSFNAGHITVVPQINSDAKYETGGLVGSVDLAGGNQTSGTETNLIRILNSYNIGSVRVINHSATTGVTGIPAIGGIIGQVLDWGTVKNNKLQIKNVYTSHMLYTNATDRSVNGIVGAYHDDVTNPATITNAYMVQTAATNNYLPYDTAGYDAVWNGQEDDPSKYFGATAFISYADRYDKSKYAGFNFVKRGEGELGGAFLKQRLSTDGTPAVDADGNEIWDVLSRDMSRGTDYVSATWRMDNDTDCMTLPLLNAQLPGSYDYFSTAAGWQDLVKQSAGKDTYDATGIVTDAAHNSDVHLHYGTDANPTLTVIGTKNDLTFNWDVKIGTKVDGSDKKQALLKFNDSIAVYGLDSNRPDLTFNNFHIEGDAGFYNGDIYTEGSLTINSDQHHTGSFGYSAGLYASDITLNFDARDLQVNGEIVTTGTKAKTGEQEEIVLTKDTDGNVTSAAVTKNENANVTGNIAINAGSYLTYGVLKTAHNGGTTTFRAIGKTAANGIGAESAEDVADFSKNMTDIVDLYTVSDTALSSGVKGDATVNAGRSAGTTGNVGFIYGNQGRGALDISGDIYIDVTGYFHTNSNYTVDGKVVLSAGDGEALIDLSNVGGDLTGDEKAKAIQAEILRHGSADTGYYYDMSHTSLGAYVIDKWDENKVINGVKGNYNFELYDYTEAGTEKTFDDAVGTLYVYDVHTDKRRTETNSLFNSWVKNAEQLTAIQRYADATPEEGGGEDILTRDFLVKNNIYFDTDDVYKGIASSEGQAYTGNFKFRNMRVVGLQTDGGIFGTLGVRTDEDGTVYRGTVTDLRVYGSNFVNYNKKDNTLVRSVIGAVANYNDGGIIDNVTLIGNSVVGYNNGTDTYVGGVVGQNREVTVGGTKYEGIVYDVDLRSTVIAQVDNNASEYDMYAGGVVGRNDGHIESVTSNAAVVANYSSVEGEETAEDEKAKDQTYGQSHIYIGGIAGVNTHHISSETDDTIGLFADQDGVSVHGITGTEHMTYMVGGIVGHNAGGDVHDAYNESIVYGHNNIGGIAGRSTSRDLSGAEVTQTYTEGRETKTIAGGMLRNVANAVYIVGRGSSKDVGGLVGELFYNAGIEIGRNTGIVMGTENVGGLIGRAGASAEDESSQTGFWTGKLESLINERWATVEGALNVGGLIGTIVGPESSGNVIHTPDTVTTQGILSEIRNFADIEGLKNVGGYIGMNNGAVIDQETLGTSQNLGDIYGYRYVGGIVGYNQSGTLQNLNNNVNLHVNTTVSEEDLRKYFRLGEDDPIPVAQYFGGVTGANEGTIINAINAATVAAQDASYVGGIVGRNLENGVLQGVGNTNTGTVYGKSFVGGAIGSNDADIKYMDSLSDVQIKNEGFVVGIAGGAGGVMGENRGNISGVTLINAGTVHGNTGADGAETDGTGGIIGSLTTRTDAANVVHGSVSGANLINTITAEVTGVSNVGGLIGYNGGIVSGGRDTADTYYAHQVYNNGTIISASFTPTTDENNKIVVDRTGTQTEQVEGAQNIGGLIGKNTGTLTAAYNTGDVESKTGTNVGGIVGYNSGTISQVFNQIVKRTATETGEGSEKTVSYTWEEGSVRGLSNVGGLVGQNAEAGTITAAYNMSTVEQPNGTTNVDALIGATSGTGTLSQLYDKTGASITVSNNGASTDKAQYTDYDFTNTWKIYEGKSNALLKVFLTKVTESTTVADTHFVYTGAAQYEDSASLIQNQKIADASGHNFASYHNTEEASVTNLINHGDVTGNIDAGTYTNGLWSLQIKTNGKDGDPNNLGYDLASVDYTIDKAKVSVALGDVYRTYGNAQMYKEEAQENAFTNYKDVATISATNTTLTTAAENNLKTNLGLANSDVTDNAVTGLDSGKTTKDVGNYNYTAKATLTNDLFKNFAFVGENDALVQELTFTATNKSHVSQATLSDAVLAEVKRTYGNATITNNEGKYKVSGITGVVNGDSEADILAALTVDQTAAKTSDTALVTDATEKANGKVTNNAGDTYTWNAAISTILTNYKLVDSATTVTGGKSTVEKAVITDATLSRVERTYGDTDLTGGTSYSITNLTGVTNGDTVANIIAQLNLADSNDGALNKKPGQTDTNDAGTYTWTGTITAKDTLTNYKFADDAASLVKNNGVSVVNKKDLTVNLKDVSRVYGQENLTDGYTYAVNTVTGAANGDTDANIIAALTFSADASKTNDTALSNETNKTTKDVGNNYEWTATFTADKTTGILKNYNIADSAKGKSAVTPASLSAVLSAVERTYGNATITSGGYTISGVTEANGDSEAAIIAALTVAQKTDGAVDGISAEDAAKGKKTNNANAAGTHYDWTADITGKTDDTSKAVLKNYTLTTTATGNSVVNKAQITAAQLSRVERTYGDTDLTKDTAYSITGLTGVTNGDTVETIAGQLTLTHSSDGAVTNLAAGHTATNDAGNYTWTGAISGTLMNYDLIGANSVITTTGASVVNKAKLTGATLSEVQRTYGNADLTNNTKYAITGLTGLVNGDDATDTTKAVVIAQLNLAHSNDGAVNVTAPKITADANTAANPYNWTGTVSAKETLKNYEIDGTTITAQGNSIVNKAELSAAVLDTVKRMYGNANITSGEYKVTGITGLVNGDENNLTAILQALKVNQTSALASDGAVTNLAQNHTTTNNVGNYNWTGTITADANAAAALNNYTLAGTASTAMGTSIVEKAVLSNLVLSEVQRTYGNTTITNNDGKYAYTVSGIVNGDSADALLTFTASNDGALTGNETGKVTNDAGNYTWTGTVTAKEGALINYKFEGDATQLQKTDGVSKVDQATITAAQLSDIVRVYGNKDLKDGYSYSVTGVSGLVNGDTWDSVKNSVTVTKTSDTALTGNDSGAVTYNAGGDYTWTGTVSANLTNYKLANNLTLTGGDSDIEKAKITGVTLSDVSRAYGNATMTGEYAITGLANLVNGDTWDSVKNSVTVTKTNDAAVDGIAQGKITNNAGSYKWTGTVSETFSNYELADALTLTGGNSVVNKATITTINGNTVTRTYGNATKDTDYAKVSLSNTEVVNGDSMSDILAQITMGDVTFDGATDGTSGNKKTNDVKDDYQWKSNATIADTSNYQLANGTQIIGTSKVTPASLNVTLSEVTRTYGSTTITNNGGEYAFTVSGEANGDDASAIKNALTATKKTDTALTGATSGRVTENAGGNYTWSADISGTADILKNYNVPTSADGGTSTVNKAKLTGVTLSGIERTYGNDTITSGGYSATAFTGLVNGDTFTDVKDFVTITKTADGAVDGIGRAKGTKTNDAGNYTWSGTVSEKTGADGKGLLTNYDLGDNASLTANANSKVNKASMTVTLSDVERVYGSATQKEGKTYGITSIATDNLNGDSLDTLKGLLTMSSIADGATNGITEEDKAKGKYTNAANHEDDAQRYYSWTANVSGNNTTEGTRLNNNYNLTITAGNSEVTTAPLSAVLSEVKRKYGRKNVFMDNTKYEISHVEGATNGDTLDAIKEALSEIDTSTIKDGALTGNTEGKVTEDVGTYSWTADVSADHTHLILRNYDFDTRAQGKSVIVKATLTDAWLSAVSRTYGNADKTGDYTISALEGLMNGDTVSDIINQLAITVKKDHAVTGETSDRVTENAGEYIWNADISAKRDAQGNSLLTNYKVTSQDSTMNKDGKSIVNQATLTGLSLSDVERTYGNADLTNNTKYAITGFTGLVNGDMFADVKDSVSITGTRDTAVDGLASGKITADVGDYEWAPTLTAAFTNYVLETNPMISGGVSKVNKAALTVLLSEVQRYEGSADLINGTSYGKTITGAVNGDDLSAVTLTVLTDGALTAGGTNGVGEYDWTAKLSGDDAVAQILSNYEIVMGTGVSAVLERPIDETDTEQTKYFFRDAPWDRNEDARERKARLHFIAGGLRL